MSKDRLSSDKNRMGFCAVYLVPKNDVDPMAGDLMHVEPYGFGGADIEDAAREAASVAESYRGFSQGTRPLIRRHDLPEGTVDVIFVNSGAWYAFEGYFDDPEAANRVAVWLEDQGLLHGHSYIVLGPSGYGEDALGNYGDIEAVAVVRDR